ncbi:transcriptional regulator, partial [Vibrio parahaemolyticus]
MLKHSANTYNSPNKPTDRLIREDERRTLTSISRS